MNDAVLVGLFERLGDLASNVERLVHWKRSVLESFRELLALDQLENEKRLSVGLFETVDGGDVRVVEELRADAPRV